LEAPWIALDKRNIMRILVLCVLLGSAAVQAQQTAPISPATSAAAQSAPSVWRARVLPDARGALAGGLPYRLFVPKNYDAAKRYPMIVYLHGSGERGVDNRVQIEKNGPPRLVSDAVQEQNPCFVLAPQCPRDKRWPSWDSRTPPEVMVRMAPEPSDPMRLLMQLLDEVPREFSIDPQRVYLTGISLGGMGTWELLARRPRMFGGCADLWAR
jgi:predicted peptidase